MAISKDKKKELVQGYGNDLSSAANVVILKQSGIPVIESSSLRMNVLNVGGKLNVIRKRLFLRSLESAGYQVVEHKDLDGAVVALYATEDEYAPLKEVQKYIKSLKKADKKYGFEYVGGWFDKEWKDAEYVRTLADLPSKEELVGKLLFLLKHPVQKLVGTLDAVKNKLDEGTSTQEAPAQEVKEEQSTESETPAAADEATTAEATTEESSTDASEADKKEDTETPTETAESTDNASTEEEATEEPKEEENK